MICIAPYRAPCTIPRYARVPDVKSGCTYHRQPRRLSRLRQTHCAHYGQRPHMWRVIVRRHLARIQAPHTLSQYNDRHAHAHTHPRPRALSSLIFSAGQQSYANEMSRVPAWETYLQAEQEQVCPLCLQPGEGYACGHPSSPMFRVEATPRCVARPVVSSPGPK